MASEVVMVGEARCSRDEEKGDGIEECDIAESIMRIGLVRVSTIRGDRDRASSSTGAGWC